MKVWAKLLVDGRNVKDTLFDDDKNKIDYGDYEEMLRSVAYLLDIPTPLALKAQYRHFNSFKVNKYAPKDFIETVDFDFLEIERYE